MHLFTCVALIHSHELQDKEQRIVELNEAEKIEPFRRRRRRCGVANELWVPSASYETTAPGATQLKRRTKYDV